MSHRVAETAAQTTGRVTLRPGFLAAPNPRRSGRLIGIPPENWIRCIRGTIRHGGRGAHELVHISPEYKPQKPKWDPKNQIPIPQKWKPPKIHYRQEHAIRLMHIWVAGSCGVTVTDQQCLDYARECVRLAQSADNQELRELLLRMAREWMAIAMHEEPKAKGPGEVDLPGP